MGETIAGGARPRVAEDVVFRDLAGEMVLLNLRSGVYFGLDAVGTRVWQLIDGHRSIDEILDTLLVEYDVTERRCEADLVEFVRALQANALVSLDESPPA